MKKTTLFLIVSLLCVGNAKAQYQPAYLVKAGTTVQESLPAHVLYHYPAFTTGIVVFRDGVHTRGKLNYNKLLEEMQFLGAKGDTLALADEKTIKLIVVETDTFYYDNGYLKLIRDTGNAKLATKMVLRVADKTKIGGYGQANATSTIVSMKNLDDGRKMQDLVVRDDMYFTEVSLYYIGDRFNHFVPANKKNLLDLFSGHKKELKDFMEQQKLDFTKNEDMDKLLQFVAQFK